MQSVGRGTMGRGRGRGAIHTRLGPELATATKTPPPKAIDFQVTAKGAGGGGKGGAGGAGGGGGTGSLRPLRIMMPIWIDTATQDPAVPQATEFHWSVSLADFRPTQDTPLSDEVMICVVT